MKIPALLLIGCFALLPLLGWADSAVGASELNLLNNVLNGYIGFAVGLVVAVIGIYRLAFNDVKGGTTMIILGVLITLTPGVFGAAHYLFCGMVSAFGSDASCGPTGGKG